MNANIGDIIVLENGLKLKLVPNKDSDYFNTYDIDKNQDCTTNYPISCLSDFCIGHKTWGYGLYKYEIVNIIKSVEKNTNTKGFYQ